MNEYLEKIKNHRMQAWNGKKQARWYARDVNDHYGFEDIDLDTQLRLICSIVSPGSRVADIGCGTGALALKLAARGYQVTGFDSSLPMMSQLRKRAKGFDIRLKQADVFHLDNALGTFDAAVSRWVLPAFPNWGEIVSSVGRVLRPGGVFVFDMKSKEHQEFFFSRRTFGGVGAENEPPEDVSSDSDPLEVVTSATAESIEAVLTEAGFELLELRPFGLFASNMLLSAGTDSEELRKSTEAVNALLRKSAPLRNLIQSLEANVTPHIPQHLLFRSLVVARRI